MTHYEISQGHRYELSGNTFAHRNELHAIGAWWDKDNKNWVLDLTSHSKTAYAKIANSIFKLTRSGVVFSEA